jgi:DNA-binding response OmpR family regulator
VVADDDPDIINLVRFHLEEEGFEVVPASDGHFALECVRRHRPDLLVLDIGMPGLNGLECLKQLRADATTAQLPVILLTARDEISDLFEGWQAGTDLYMTKPFEKQTLLDYLARIFTPVQDQDHPDQGL